jgi:hypothetical protein
MLIASTPGRRFETGLWEGQLCRLMAFLLISLPWYSGGGPGWGPDRERRINTLTTELPPPQPPPGYQGRGKDQRDPQLAKHSVFCRGILAAVSTVRSGGGEGLGEVLEDPDAQHVRTLLKSGLARNLL